MTEPPSFTCPRCGMTSYNPHDIRWSYCGNCKEHTGHKLAGTSWQANPVVTDKPVVRHGPTPPPVPSTLDIILRWIFTLIALASIVYIVIAVVIT